MAYLQLLLAPFLHSEIELYAFLFQQQDSFQAGLDENVN
jgi:hypothetical protein